MPFRPRGRKVSTPHIVAVRVAVVRLIRKDADRLQGAIHESRRVQVSVPDPMPLEASPLRRDPRQAATWAPPRRAAARQGRGTYNEAYVDQRDSARRVARGHRRWPEPLRSRY